MAQQQDENLQAPKNEGQTDKLFMEDGSSLQSPEEAAKVKKDDYCEVDEKKLVITNIGDGAPHDEGLAGIDEATEDREED